MTADQLSMFEGGAEISRKVRNGKPLNLSVSRTISASAETIFDRWLIPTFVGKWMFGTHVENEKVVELKNDVRPRGEFTYKVQRPGKEVIFRGEYQRIDRPKQLKFSWQENDSPISTINVSFEPNESKSENKTKLKISIQVDRSMSDEIESIKRQWSARCKALSSQLSK